MNGYVMIDKEIVSSKAFLNMPKKAQLLYFHLAVHAEKNGNIFNLGLVLKGTSANSQDLSDLMDAGFATYKSNIVSLKVKQRY